MLSYGALLPEVASGNTSVLFEGQIERPLSDAGRAMLLLVNMSCCFGGKKVDKTVVLSPGLEKSSSARPGPALCSGGLLHSFFLGRTWRETIWLNLLTRTDLASERVFSEGVGIPPWEKMPGGEDDAVAHALQSSLMGRLVPMARFYLLEPEGIHSVEGIQHPDYLHGGVFDPSAAALLEGFKGKIRMIWADPDKRPWRILTALLSFLQKDGKASCLQLKWGAARLSRSGLKQFRIWSGGIRLSSNAGEQYLSGSDDVVESELTLFTDWLNGEDSDWFDQLQGAMSRVDTLGNRLYKAVWGYFQEEKVDNADELAKRASREFWQLAERHFYALTQACASEEVEKNVTEVLRWLWSCVQDCYARTCPKETARQLQHWAEHRPLAERKSNKG